MRFELGSEVIYSLITLIAIHPIPAASPVKVAKSVSVFTCLKIDICFIWQTKKKINSLLLISQESVVVLVEAVVLVYQQETLLLSFSSRVQPVKEQCLHLKALRLMK